MLQDMASGRLENEFRNIAAGEEDVIICFHEGQVLLCRGEDDSLTLPVLSHIATRKTSAAPRYLFRMQEQNYFLWTDSAPIAPWADFSYEPVRQLRQMKSKEICFAVMTAWHLYNWYRANRLCGCCGTPPEHDSKETGTVCPTGKFPHGCLYRKHKEARPALPSRRRHADRRGAYLHSGNCMKDIAHHPTANPRFQRNRGFLFSQ